jgi:RNA polymerase sigma factor (sigma-70 family)
VGNNDSAVSAATAIFNEHGEFIRVILRSQAGSGLDVEDLRQEFYIALLRKPVPAEVQDVRGYLYRALVHHVISAARRRGTYSRAMKKYAKEAKISVYNRGPENAFISEEHQNAAVNTLARYLQDREAEAFVMKYRDECSIPEIATKMGIDKRTVSRYLSESLRKLHRRLAPE